jgi:hypothetical protein
MRSTRIEVELTLLVLAHILKVGLGEVRHIIILVTRTGIAAEAGAGCLGLNELLEVLEIVGAQLVNDSWKQLLET